MTQTGSPSNIGGIAVEVKLPITTIATGSDPAANTIAPGAPATDVDLFTLQTNSGTEAIASVTVNLSTNSGVGRLAITDNAGTELGFTTSPATGSNTIAVAGMSATTTLTTFRVRVTPLSHAAMPLPSGAAYAITAPVTAWVGSNAHAGSDTNANALTIDNLSPTGATAVSGSAGDARVTLNWTTSVSADFSRSVVLRWTGAAAGAEVPAEGTDYVNGNTIGSATVACVRTADPASTAVSGVDGAGTGGCGASALVVSQAYTYKIFQKDANGNYDVGVPIGPFTTLPRVVSINCSVSCAATSFSTVSWTVTFSASVTGVDASAFALVASGLSGTSITAVTGSGTTWTVSANTGLGAGTLGLNQTGPGSVSPTLSGTFTGQVYTISAPPLLAEYRMDEALWNGTANEVADISGNGNHARAFNGASTVGTSPAITGNPGTCNYGVFDNGGTITQGYVQTPLPDLTTDFTVTAWIRTINNTVSGQRILIDDQNNSGGYGISLGDGTAGILRFFSRGITPVILDSTYTIANNTWYFVAAVADITNKKRTIYVFSAAGALLNTTTEGAWTGGAWGTDAGPVSIGGEVNGPPQTEVPASFHFHGNLDEVRVYQQALSPAAVTAIATQTHACAIVVAVPNHYELSLPTSSIACLATPVTVTACTDATSPCTNPFAGASGSTATLATSGGTLGTTTVSFDATGVASTTLSYSAAPDATPVTITLSNELIAASNPRQWCPNGTACVVANSGTTTFNTAGFIFSTAAGGGVATIPTQVAGITSATNYLRAVKSSTTTQACEAALTGTSAVNFAYECNNPATCYTSNLMSVNGGIPTTIARNDNGSVSSYLPVNLTFDGSGNAPFTFNYSDAGLVKLWASKSAGGLLLSALAGSSNSFVVKPHHFDITNIACTTVGAGTCAPANVTGNNPGASSAAGAAFIQAGQPFKATVTAMNGAATPAFTPNFGKETTAEGAELTSFNHLPGLGGATAISRVLSGFNSGAATLTDLAWSEVGVLQLKATLSNANGYLGSDAVNGKNAVVSAVNPYVGRFIPDHFDTVVTPQGGGFAYSGNPVGPVPGQPFTVTVTAKSAAASPTANYYYLNPGDFAKNVNLSVPVGTGQLYVDAVAGGAGAVPAGKFVNTNPGEGKINYSDATGKISFVFASLPHAEQAIQVHAEDADTVTSSGANGNINIRQGRLRLFNAFGSEQANLSMPVQAEYWTGNSWVLNSADSFTVIPAGSIALSGYLGTLSAANLGASHIAGTTLANGQGSIVLAMPSPTATGSVDLAINLGVGAADQSCLTTHPGTTGAAIPWLRSIYGSCAATYDRDPSARGSFGVYAPETRKTVHVRELF
jgi:MSHA biogenesis protein MshQ